MQPAQKEQCRQRSAKTKMVDKHFTTNLSCFKLVYVKEALITSQSFNIIFIKRRIVVKAKEKDDVLLINSVHNCLLCSFQQSNPCLHPP